MRMTKWRNCTFLHSMWSSPCLLRNEQFLKESRFEAFCTVQVVFLHVLCTVPLPKNHIVL